MSLSYTHPSQPEPTWLAPAIDQGTDVQILRNIGGKPLRVHANLIAEGSNRAQEGGPWHEIALYRTDSGQIAVALRLVGPGAASLGVHRARLFPHLDEAASWLESFDPAADMAVDFDVSDQAVSVASMALQAAALRERAVCLERAYRGLVGEVLFQLALAG